ncbi:MAG: thiopurine S-methyltransferase [Alphaproteobacteria bacterium]|nr:thiopurine S-methyltransferase [Alphaproteobacteria bacterium]
MTPDFWQEAWRIGRIGFHQADVDAQLAAHWPTLDLPPSARVLVPLCGKSLDLWWLRDRGHEVVGVELSPLACEAFFREAGVEPTVETSGPYTAWSTEGLTILQGDVFDLPAEPAFDAAYDRAATVALPDDLRRRHARGLAAALKPGAPLLLVTFDMDGGDRAGPPFPVPAAAVHQLYDASFDVRTLARTPSPELAKALGVDTCHTETHALVRR